MNFVGILGPCFTWVLRFDCGHANRAKKILEDLIISILDLPIYSSLGLGFFKGFRLSPKKGDARYASRLWGVYLEYKFQYISNEIEFDQTYLTRSLEY